MTWVDPEPKKLGLEDEGQKNGEKINKLNDNVGGREVFLSKGSKRVSKKRKKS